MKLLVVSTSFPLHAGSSSGVFIKRLVDELEKISSVSVVAPDGRVRASVESSYTVHLFRYAPKCLQRLAHEPGGLPVALKRQPASFALVPSFLISFFFAIWHNSKQVDAIQANWSLPGLLAGVVGWLRGVPVVTTLRGDDVSNLKSSRLKRAVLLFLVRFNLKLVTVSQAMASDIAGYCAANDDKICHIPNGVSDAFFEVKPLVRSERPLRLLSIGSLIHRKQAQIAIRALAIAGGKTTLTIAGDGPEKTALIGEAKQRGVLDRVCFLGPVKASDVPQLLESHDALVLCSSSEGRPNVVIEAMAAGRGILATNLPGVSELVEHGQSGLLFGVGDAHMLASHIRELETRLEVIESMGAAARQSILNAGLSWRRCAESYLELFSQRKGKQGR